MSKLELLTSLDRTLRVQYLGRDATLPQYVTAVLPENPLRMRKALAGELEGLRSARRGDYRVIFELDESAHVIVLLRVAHGAHVYRPD